MFILQKVFFIKEINKNLHTKLKKAVAAILLILQEKKTEKLKIMKLLINAGDSFHVLVNLEMLVYFASMSSFNLIEINFQNKH